MVLSLKEAVDLHEHNIVGIPMRPSETAIGLLAEVALLRETLAAKDEHLQSLRTEIVAWHQRSQQEMQVRAAEQAAGFERERELISMVHRQMGEIDMLRQQALYYEPQLPPEPQPRRRGIFRRKRA